MDATPATVGELPLPPPTTQGSPSPRLRGSWVPFLTAVELRAFSLWVPPCLSWLQGVATASPGIGEVGSRPGLKPSKSLVDVGFELSPATSSSPRCSSQVRWQLGSPLSISLSPEALCPPGSSQAALPQGGGPVRWGPEDAAGLSRLAGTVLRPPRGNWSSLGLSQRGHCGRLVQGSTPRPPGKGLLLSLAQSPSLSLSLQLLWLHHQTPRLESLCLPRVCFPGAHAARRGVCWVSEGLWREGGVTAAPQISLKAAGMPLGPPPTLDSVWGGGLGAE